MEREIYYEYDVKCRKCGRVTRKIFGTSQHCTKDEFKEWVKENSIIPISAQCECDRGMMMLHDIVAFGNVLVII